MMSTLVLATLQPQFHYKHYYYYRRMKKYEEDNLFVFDWLEPFDRL